MPRPVSISRSLTSLSRVSRPLSRYWLSPPRDTRRPTVMRPSSAPGRSRSVRRVSMHSAMPSGLRLSEPLKMTSSMVPPRSDLALCSPSTQVMASERLLLPQPLGPTMAVTPPAKRTSTGSTKDLKPETSRRSTLSMGSLRPDRGSLPDEKGRPQDMGAGEGGALDVGKKAGLQPLWHNPCLILMESSMAGFKARVAAVAVLGLLGAGGRTAALPLPEGRPALRFYSSEQGLPQSVVLCIALD